LGTGGPKVALVAVDGSTLAWSSRPVATRFIDGGGAEQDPHRDVGAIVGATRRRSTPFVPFLRSLLSR
jgi:hypothetical protein